ncbi:MULTISPECIES: HEAT repeat domain-containing protein [Pseudanabaena]|uniref:PBS lyase HEAT domain protein repeat-containing protein n=2 Tax=Pseudanabaena TaxID=1152 RepID=L8MZ76_9CYAN|nr:MULTISPECIES: HEAT repeat domain-containing protein [Pseudanabaena]ELS33267.1 PBS lyase HEAT domain protein repeat-containing protein [Pseudanabaena biceps PCC 7429]MDG3494525.1 HEAT repeat domain-containing protein [Pseudanabaena catenata USMAC16]
MNKLNKALQRIQNWLEIHRPNYVNSLQPGLTRKEIEEKVSLFPIQLSEEVYTLYEWHNGSDSWEFFFPGYCFPSFENAIADMYSIDSEFSSYTLLLEEIDTYFLLPVFSYDFTSISTLEIDTKRDHSLVLKSIPEETPSMYSFNLTRMIEVIAQCFESGAYYMRKRNNDESEVTWNYEMALEIHRINNNEIVEFTLEKINSIKLEKSTRIMGNLYYLIEWFGDSRAVDPLIEILQTPFDNQPNQHNLAIAKDLSAYGLGKLHDSRAVDPLIDALSIKYGNGNTRYKVTEALGELGDNRAIPSLIGALSDPDERICNSGMFSLVKLGAIDELLKTALERKNRYAIQALGLLPSSINKKKLTSEQKDRIFSVLMSLTKDSSYEIQNIANKSLDRARREVLEHSYER